MDTSMAAAAVSCFEEKEHFGLPDHHLVYTVTPRQLLRRFSAPENSTIVAQVSWFSM
jgi:hypothetical protein